MKDAGRGFPHPLSPQAVELIAQRFAVLAEPMRIRILDHLRAAGEACVTDIALALDATHANVSRHLNVLHAAAILSRRKDGTHVRYRVSDPGVFRLCEDVCGAFEARQRELWHVLSPSSGQPEREVA